MNPDEMKVIDKMVQDTWIENEEIADILSGKHDDVFTPEEKIQVIKIIEQDNYDMRIQRIISGIERRSKKAKYQKSTQQLRKWKTERLVA